MTGFDSNPEWFDASNGGFKKQDSRQAWCAPIGWFKKQHEWHNANHWIVGYQA